MNADQWQQVGAGVVALLGAIGGNGWVRGKQTARTEASNSELAGQIQGLQTALSQTNDKIVRLEVRIESTELADQSMSRDLQQARVAMHSLGGRIDASNALYTEILEKAKARQQPSQTTEQAGNPADLQDQTTLTVKKKDG